MLARLVVDSSAVVALATISEVFIRLIEEILVMQHLIYSLLEAFTLAAVSP